MDRRTPVDEAAIRADERAKCVAELEQHASEYVMRMGPIVGWDDAKADGWNILVAARRLKPDSATGDGK